MSGEWRIMMLTDSALPTGGFVASFGLEAAVYSRQANYAADEDLSTRPKSTADLETDESDKILRDPTSLMSFFAASLHTQACTCIPYVSQTWQCLKDLYFSPENVLKALRALDNSFDAMIGGNHVARRASRAQGVAFLTLIDKSFLDSTHPLHEVVSSFKKDIRGSRSAGHVPITFAIACKCLGLSLDRTMELFVFQHARSLVSAAVRLNIIGPYKGQKILLSLQRESNDALAATLSRTTPRDDQDSFWDSWDDEFGKDPVLMYARQAAEEACATAPKIDIIQGLHDRLYSRLFNS
ncbi:hypothetical protein HDV05_004776 [Chytridiales sp. JEL 0842]|nr:hypothetical protein HDV05_004776 [Chytridiales sp. JEL 0842]